MGGWGGGGVEGRRIFLDLKTNVVDDGANSESRYRLLTKSVKVGLSDFGFWIHYVHLVFRVYLDKILST